MAQAFRSEGEKVLEIQSLTAQVQSLSNSVDRWNTGMLWAIVATAIAAVLVALTTRMVIFRSRQLATAQANLGEAQNREFQLALTQLKNSNLVLEGANLRLEKLIQPRSLTLDQQREIGKSLLPFKGHKISILWTPADPETFNFASQIKASLDAGELDVAPLNMSGREWIIGESHLLSGIKITCNPVEKRFGTAMQHGLSTIGHVKDVYLVDGNVDGLVISVRPKPFDLLPEAHPSDPSAK